MSATTMNVLTGAKVAEICKIAKTPRERTRAEAYALIAACDRRLKQASEGTLALADDVRLPMEAVVRVLWKIRLTALEQWKAAKAADLAAGAAEAEASFVGADAPVAA